MGLLKQKDKKTSSLGSHMRGGGASGTQISPLRPRMQEKLPPCTHACPSGNDIRGWLMVISLRDKLGISLDEATEMAWRIEVETNPFPGVMGRVCPHPCEGECNRGAKDGAVSVNALERHIGDWALAHDLRLQTMPGEDAKTQRIAVIGAGPAGLSCAYQLARRGYAVTVFESLPRPGGMLRYGIPVYRLPREVLDSEIQRILDLGVELRCGVTVGKDVTLEALRSEFDAVFLGIGAHQGRKLGVPGEDGDGVYTGTEFLNAVNSGRSVAVGGKVVVIGGGDTAIDAARVSKRVAADSAGISRRLGAEVTILYRRTRTEMPAIDREIDEALEEGVAIEYLTAPVKVLRNDAGAVTGILVQRMELGEPDASGRRRPVPVEGDVFEVAADTIITAVSQQPDTSTLGSLDAAWIEADDWGRTHYEKVWSGGDNITLGLATTAIGQGRRAAEAIHASMQGREPEARWLPPVIHADKVRLDWYEAKPRAERLVLGPEARLAEPDREVDGGITEEQALAEFARCFSCGKCFGCENCWMYCQNSGFKKTQSPTHGHFYDIKMEVCDGCKKCWEECPCGFIEGQ